MTYSANIQHLGHIYYMGREPKQVGRYNRGHRVSNKQYTHQVLSSMHPSMYEVPNKKLYTVSAPNRRKLQTKNRRQRNPISPTLLVNVKTWLNNSTKNLHKPYSIPIESVPNRRYFGPVDDRLHHHKTSRKMKPDLTRWMRRSLDRLYAPPGMLNYNEGKGGKGYHVAAGRFRSRLPRAAVAIPRRSTKRKRT